MKLAKSVRGCNWKVKALRLGVVLATVFPTTLLSACSEVIHNSASYYENIPRRPINWREYLTD
ncbi:MAG TPA: hypothetical protein VMT22_21550 [Terriglobales bacterium]|jgi:hypothetical protein|nr:hypothetical protein [Terriglobales bacterium]